MFDTLEMAPADPILGLTEAFKADPNPDKINLSVGVYLDGDGRTPILSSVKKAEERLLATEKSKSYLPMTGSPEFASAVQELLFGAGSEVISSKRAVTAQSPGGTGGLRVAGDLFKAVYPGARIWLSDPTWANHNGIFTAAGLELGTYPYYDAEQKCLAFDKMMAAINQIPAGDIVLLHGCCHNPTGMDPTIDQWTQIAAVLAKRKLVAMVDFAYQGLAEGLEEDAASVRVLCEPGREVVIASSFSKNFGLYRERVGAVTIVCGSAETAEKAASHLKLSIRRKYSNPPSHGGAIVATVLSDPQLRKEWEGEVAVIRDRIHEMRRLVVDTLKAKGVKQDFSFIVGQNGMFSFSGLTKDQVDTLRKKNAIYIVGSGRINVAGLTKGSMDRFCEAVAAVL